MDNNYEAFSELYMAVKALASMVGDIAIECACRGLLVSKVTAIAESYSRVRDHLDNANAYIQNEQETNGKLSGVTEI